MHVARIGRLGVMASAIHILWSIDARAAGPACDAGACSDNDGDGFVACACAPAGVACDCDDGDPSAFPGAPEACDSDKDRNCNGASKEGCAKENGCLKSVCVQRCIPLDDFGCPPTSGTQRQPDNTCLCAPQDCTLFGCAPGFTCDDATACVPNCDPGVKCPFGQRCRGFGCVDPCKGINCPQGSSCVDGLCKAACDCPGSQCAPGETCDPGSGKCVESTCVGLSCAAGSHCERGTCVENCAGVVCPPKRVCRSGGSSAECIDLCNPSPCPLGYRCDWRTAACSPPDVGDGGLFTPEGPAIDPLDVVGGGLACTATRSTAALGTLGVVALAFLAAILRRRSVNRTR